MWKTSAAQRALWQVSCRPRTPPGTIVKVVQRIPVRIRFKPDQQNLDKLRPGMSVEPEVRVGELTWHRRADRPSRHVAAIPQPLDCRHDGNAGDVHGSARFVHRECGTASYRRHAGRQLRRVDVGTDQLSGLKRHCFTGLRMAVHGIRPQTILHDLRGALHARLRSFAGLPRACRC